ncbi:MAG: hypothetical protein AAGU11_19135 [Syntrophobacteraceae bacterium]
MRVYAGVFLALLLIGNYGCCTNAQAPLFRCGPVSGEPEILRNTQFNHLTVLKVRSGMPLNEFESIFGPPDRSSSNTLESKVTTSIRQLVYEYDMGKHPNAHYPAMFNVNKFYFNADQDPPVLNRWDIDYVY